MNIRRHSLTVATVALIIAGAGWAIIQAPTERPKRSRPERAAITRPAPASPPSARDILDAAALLDLKTAQRIRLRALDATWGSESAAAQEQLNESMADFSRFMDEARAAGRTSLQEIQHRSAEISELSAALRERRQRHAEAAAAILTEWQRTRLTQATRPVASGGSDETR